MTYGARAGNGTHEEGRSGKVRSETPSKLASVTWASGSRVASSRSYGVSVQTIGDQEGSLSTSGMRACEREHKCQDGGQEGDTLST